MTKDKFLWGSATSAYQCEGGWNADDKGISNWDDFCHSEKNNINCVTGDVASDFYHRYEEDIKLLSQGGQNAYRFSLAWTRIIPGGKTNVSQAGIDFYNRVIDTCEKYNVEPFVTLYHYDMPIEYFKNGGWENRETVEAFIEYAKVCFKYFGHRVKYWATINEPNYETYCCYGRGNYPPNVKDLSRRWKAMYHLLLASAGAVIEYRKLNLSGMIGIVSDSYSIEALVDNEAYQEAIKNADLFYNKCVNDVSVTGKYSDAFITKLKSEYDLSYMKEEDKEIFEKGIVDYLGINAYDRILVKPYTTGETGMVANNIGDGFTKNATIIKNWFELDEDPNTKKNAWGCEIYPKSIYNLLLALNAEYPKTPIIITENGLGYYDDLVDGKVHDGYRIEFLNGFIDWMKKAMGEGCDVRGYFVWSTMDLYSWINGYKKRYGLVYIDYDHDNKRILKDSYYWYKTKIQESIRDE